VSATTITRRYTQEDRSESIYQYVEFDVPQRAEGVTVSFSYDRRAAIIDLGLFNPQRYVGWSGGERSTATVARDWATPGYLPGLAAGPWQVIFGLHRVFAPVEVTVGVEWHRSSPVEPSSRPRPPRPEKRPRPDRPPPADDGRDWLACDFHSHTVHSDGGLTIDELAAHAVERGLDVLAITDHNTTSHHRFLADSSERYGIALIPGQEVTTDMGHANVFGDVGWIDFRQPATTWHAEARRRGAPMSVNHHWAGDCSWRHRLDEPADFVEAWHSTWDGIDDTPSQASRQFGRVAIGGSDFHRPGGGVTLGTPTTWVAADDRTGAAVLAAVAAGRVTVSYPHRP
jgi:hypothetical protein